MTVWRHGMAYLTQIKRIPPGQVQIVTAGCPPPKPRAIACNPMFHPVITLSGHKRTESEENGEFHRREISSQEFVRTISLPVPVDVEKAVASCKDGLLEITLPKREVVRKQKLTIQTP